MSAFDLAPALQRLALQRVEGDPEAAEDEHALQTLQRQAGNAAVAAALQREDEGVRSPVLDIVGRGGGRPLESALRTDMEARIGADFSDVRVHDDAAAQRSATAVGARAYTSGHEVVLGEGVTTDSDEGRHTLAHELTHVVQQRSGPVDGTPSGDGVSISDPSDRFEQEAEANAARVMSDPTPAPVMAGGGAAVQSLVQREEVPEDEDVQPMALQREDAGLDDDDDPVPG